MLTWDDIAQTEFYTNNKVLLDNVDASKNGRVYKVYAIARALSSLQDGEYMIYSDCSPEIWKMDEDFIIPDTYSLDVMKSLCQAANDILAAFVRWDTRKIPAASDLLGIHTHENFTTDRCMRVMGLERYRRSFMPASGMIMIRKTAKTEAFVDEWLKWNCNPEAACLGKPEIPDDFSYWDGSEDDLKMGHRHDQSIFGLLMCRDGYHLLWPPGRAEMPNHNPLLYCMKDFTYKFMDPNINPDHERRIRKGDKVINAKGIELQVFEIRRDDDVEWLIVGVHRESCYRTQKHLVTLKR